MNVKKPESGKWPVIPNPPENRRTKQALASGATPIHDSRKRTPTKLIGPMVSLACFWAMNDVPQMNATSKRIKSARIRVIILLLSSDRDAAAFCPLMRSIRWRGISSLR